MRRRQFITILGGAAATWPLTVRAQQPERVRRVVVWMARAVDEAEEQRRVTAFRQGLQALGWTDGRNIRTDYRWEAR
jgi:putative tryptophan/tyrosine transport system substrate-binding protein